MPRVIAVNEDADRRTAAVAAPGASCRVSLTQVSHVCLVIWGGCVPISPKSHFWCMSGCWDITGAGVKPASGER